MAYSKENIILARELLKKYNVDILFSASHFLLL